MHARANKKQTRVTEALQPADLPAISPAFHAQLDGPPDDFLEGEDIEDAPPKGLTLHVLAAHVDDDEDYVPSEGKGGKATRQGGNQKKRGQKNAVAFPQPVNMYVPAS